MSWMKFVVGTNPPCYVHSQERVDWTINLSIVGFSLKSTTRLFLLLSCRASHRYDYIPMVPQFSPSKTAIIGRRPILTHMISRMFAYSLNKKTVLTNVSTVKIILGNCLFLLCCSNQFLCRMLDNS